MAANIRFDIQGGSQGVENRSRSDIALTDIVEIVNVDPGSVNSSELLSRPVGSTATITGSSPTWELEPDLAGSYRIRMVVDNVVITRTFTVLTEHLGLHMPAHNERASENATIAKDIFVEKSETNEGSRDEDRQKGWAKPMEENLKAIDVAAGVTSGHISDTDNPHETDVGNLGSGTFAELDAAVTDEELANRKMLLDKTGFPSPNSLPLGVSLSFVNGTRTFTLTPTAATFDFWQAGVWYEKTGAQSIVLPDTTGLYVVYYHLGVLGYILNPTQGQVSVAIRTYPLAGYVYYDATIGVKAHNYLGYELHGLEMSGDTHANIHFNPNGGAFVAEGLALNGILADESGALDSHAQFGMDAGVTSDEDLVNLIDAVGSTTGLPMFYLEGATAVMKRAYLSGFSVLTDVAAGTGATGRLVWNELTGGSYQLTTVGNNDFICGHVFGTNDKDQGDIAVIGQAVYATAGLARTGAASEIGTIKALFLMEELTEIGTAIFQVRDAYGNAVKARIISTEDGDDYIDWRKTTIAPGGSAPTDHQSLSGKTTVGTEDGTYNHLAATDTADFVQLTDTSNADDLHEHVHAKTTGKDADDHEQYLLVDGTRAMTGDFQALANGNLVAPTTRAGTPILGTIRVDASSGILEFYNGSDWVTAGMDKLKRVEASAVAEGNNSITGFVNKANIKDLQIETTSTSWTLTIYESDDYSTRPWVAMVQGSGNKKPPIDLLYEDQDGTAEFHYTFTSASGSETHNIKVGGIELQ